MKDLIERQIAFDQIGSMFAVTPTQKDMVEDCLEIIENLPSAQPEIIRCRDCKWKQGAECVRFADVRPFADDFCSRAERRTDEE